MRLSILAMAVTAISLSRALESKNFLQDNKYLTVEAEESTEGEPIDVFKLVTIGNSVKIFKQNYILHDDDQLKVDAPSGEPAVEFSGPSYPETFGNSVGPGLVPRKLTEPEQKLYTTVTKDITITVAECYKVDTYDTIIQTTIKTYCSATSTCDLCENIPITTSIENAHTNYTSVIDPEDQDEKELLTGFDNDANSVFVQGYVGTIVVILPLFM